MKPTIIETQFKGVSLFKRGKVRDIYDLGEHLLIVATDRISAFDVIMSDPIPDKGLVLNQISLYWMELMTPIIQNHLTTAAVDEYPAALKPYADQLRGRSMIVRKTDPIPIECVVRGYLSGSGWKSYLKTKSVCGIELPDGLRESDKLPQPIFTPSTKEEVGLHDINIDFAETAARVGHALAEKLKSLSLQIYQKAVDIADAKGIIIADTKFEFGLAGNDIYLIDEILTPDSSRFWPKSAYQPGGAQQSFDKQFVRDYLESVKWPKQPPPPPLPPEVIANTRQKYLEAFRLLTGRDLEIA